MIIADHPKLELQLLVQREKLRKRIVEIEGLTRMNSGSLLTAVEFVHLEARERRRFVRGQVERLARRDGRSPVPGADIVARAGVESSGRRQESEDTPNVGAGFPPGKDDRLIECVGQSASSTDFALRAGSERVVGDRQRSGGGRDLVLPRPGRHLR